MSPRTREARLQIRLYNDTASIIKSKLTNNADIKELGISYENDEGKTYTAIWAFYKSQPIVLRIWPTKAHDVSETTIYMIWSTIKMYNLDINKIESVALYLPRRVQLRRWKAKLASGKIESVTSTPPGPRPVEMELERNHRPTRSSQWRHGYIGSAPSCHFERPRIRKTTMRKNLVDSI